MKKILAILFLSMLCISARAQLIYGTLTITNTPTNGYTFTIQGNQFYWTNGASGGLAVQYTNNFGADATNLFNVSGLILPFQGITCSNNVATSNVLVFSGPALVASISTNWATLTFTTNSGVAYTNVIVPQSAVANAARGPTMTQLAKDLDTYAAYSFATGDQLHSNYAGLAETNVFTGTNSFAVLNAAGGKLTNMAFLNPTMTNGQNFGAPFRSPGTGTGSEQFGISASATASGGVAFGDNAQATNVDATAIGLNSIAGGVSSVTIGATSQSYATSDISIGNGAGASGPASIAIGASASTLGFGSISIGNSSQANQYNAMAIGNGSSANYVGSAAIGQSATSSQAGQIVVGVSTNWTLIPGTLTVSGTISNPAALNLTTSGSNILGGMIAFPRTANSSLANGYNADISTGIGSYLVLTGPSAAFTNVGFAGGYDGRIVRVRNGTQPSVSMTFLDESGIDSTATNRIWTGQNGPLVLANSNSVATLVYDISAARWIVTSHN